MSVIYAPESAHAKELCKWEAQHTAAGPGLRPYVYRPYPCWLYKAGRPTGGPVAIVDAQIAETETERRLLEQRGFVAGGQQAAIEAFHRQDQEYAELAASRAYSDRQMSAKAQAEADAIDRQTSDHLPAIPEQPKPRKGRRVDEVSHE